MDFNYSFFKQVIVTVKNTDVFLFLKYRHLLTYFCRNFTFEVTASWIFQLLKKLIFNIIQWIQSVI